MEMYEEELDEEIFKPLYLYSEKGRTDVNSKNSTIKFIYEKFGLDKWFSPIELGKHYKLEGNPLTRQALARRLKTLAGHGILQYKRDPTRKRLDTRWFYLSSDAYHKFVTRQAKKLYLKRLEFLREKGVQP